MTTRSPFARARAVRPVAEPSRVVAYVVRAFVLMVVCGALWLVASAATSSFAHAVAQSVR